jgi:hypothetical protein
MALGTAVGWGLVIVTTGQSKGLTWLGYLMDGVTVNGHTYLDLGGTDGPWAYANLGVPIALAIGFVGYLLFGTVGVRRQERQHRRIEAAEESDGRAASPA